MKEGSRSQLQDKAAPLSKIKPPTSLLLISIDPLERGVCKADQLRTSNRDHDVPSKELLFPTSNFCRYTRAVHKERGPHGQPRELRKGTYCLQSPGCFWSEQLRAQTEAQGLWPLSAWGNPHAQGILFCEAASVTFFGGMRDLPWRDAGLEILSHVTDVSQKEQLLLCQPERHAARVQDDDEDACTPEGEVGAIDLRIQ